VETRRIFNLILLLLGLYLLVVVLLFIFQRTLIYFPTPEYPHSYRQISLRNENVSIEIIVVNEDNNKAFIYFGGNAETVIANAQDFSFAFPNRTIYLVNYRGYGGSTGKPTEAGLFSDALGLFDKIQNDHTEIAVIGRSLGTGVAMYLAANRAVDQVVLITPYDSILALAQNRFPIFPMSFLLKDKFDSFSLANDVKNDVLIIAGAKDTLIPNKHTQRLVNELGLEHTKLILIDEAGHNDISQYPVFYRSIKAFLNSNNNLAK
jgi:pimeloyl-ACP methyl ester carboxylesterase